MGEQNLFSRLKSTVIDFFGGGGKGEWRAYGLTRAQTRRLEEITVEYFKRRNKKLNLQQGIVSVTGEDTNSAESFGEINLHNLSQRLRQLPRDEWEEAAADFFATMLAVSIEVKEFKSIERDFEKASKYLTVRIWPTSALAPILAKHPEVTAVFREDLPGTYSVLSFDLPSGYRQVTQELLEIWGRDKEELFEVGLANICKTLTPQFAKVWEDLTVFAFSGESFLVPSYALLLDRCPAELGGQCGSLVGVPSRNVLFVAPIESIHFTSLLQPLARLIANTASNQPAGISHRMYWHRNGRFVDLPYRLEKGDRKLVFNPPEEFNEMVLSMKEHCS